MLLAAEAAKRSLRVSAKGYVPLLCALLALPAIGCAHYASPNGTPDTPVRIPLTVAENPHFGTYSAKITIALGNGKPLPFGFDSGSSGLHAFADAGLDAPGSGVQCTQTPTHVTYGNPPRITFSGVVCYAQLHFAKLSTPAAVPIAYLTSASCPSTNPECRLPNLHSPKAMDGYGIFGAGLTGVMSGDGNVPNPILMLSGRRGTTYNVILTRNGGTLELGGDEPPGSAEFQLEPGTRPGQRYALPRTCLFVNGRATSTCLLISFDTGNGVPWIHSADARDIPQHNGLVTPGTRLGFAPPGAATEASSVVAGTSFADSIRIVDIPGKPPLTNAGIQAFFDRVVTYDDARGVISVGYRTSHVSGLTGSQSILSR